MEKETIIFQRGGFDNYYRSVLNGGKYVDPDCREDIDTPYYNCLSKTTSCASGSEKLLAMYQKSPPKVLY